MKYVCEYVHYFKFQQFLFETKAQIVFIVKQNTALKNFIEELRWKGGIARCLKILKKFF